MLHEWPPEKQHTQVVDNQQNGSSLFLRSLHPVGRGWGANQSPEPAAVGAGCHRATGSAVTSVKSRGATPLYGVHVASRRWLSFFR